jgi:fumarate reductase flavoprotein subunit
MDLAGTADMSRRALLKGVGGLSLAALTSSARAQFLRSTWDLIVIGGGTAGLPAAIHAAARGARVLIIEQAAQLGGTLHLSSGQIAAAGTVFQAREGISDSPQAHYEDAMRINDNTSDPHLLRLWTQHGAATINWLAEHGFETAPGHPVAGGNHEPYTSRRYLWGPDEGRSILRVLMQLVEPHIDAGRIDVLLETGAVELIQNSVGRVTGVVVEDTAGARQDIPGSQVLLAAGGCAANPRMYQELHGVPLYCQVAYPYSQGTGLMLGLGAGGHLQGGEKYLGLFGTVMTDAWVPAALDVSLALNPLRRKPWELYVNQHGQRFVREDLPGVHHREMALNEQPGHRFWVIFDERALAQAPPLVGSWNLAQLREAFHTHPMFFSAATLGSLAARVGIHPLTLQRTVAEYNDARERGENDVLGREHRPSSIDTGPYYAIQCQGWTLVSFAGLVVDEQLRVLHDDGAPIPGLYAAGEILGAGATSGKGYVGGALVTPALTFGKLLGERLTLHT